MILHRLRHSLRYAKAAPWPYVTCALSLLLAFGLGTTGLGYWAVGVVPVAAACGWWGLCWLVVALFALADAVSRYRECRRIMLMFHKFGYSTRILEPLARSRCQRDAAVFAATQMGHGDSARAHYRTLGYRWYHILPDSVMRNPFNFLRPSFLRSSFMPGKKARMEA